MYSKLGPPVWVVYSKGRLEIKQVKVFSLLQIQATVNGQSVKSRQTRWEWQLLISIMHIHDVVTLYNNCPFLCACASTG